MSKLTTGVAILLVLISLDQKNIVQTANEQVCSST